MAEEKKQLDKILQTVTQSQKTRVTDFDSGLLQSCFETKPSNPREQYNEHRKDLTNVTARLMQIRNKEADNYNQRFENILSEIQKFFEKPLPNITPKVDDTAQKDRIMKLVRSDGADGSCTSETLHTFIDGIREEQYNTLIQQACYLKAKALSYLKEDIFSWHFDDGITEITVGEDNNGRK